MREIIQTVAKGMLTLSSADETDKSNNTTKIPQQGFTSPAQVTDSDVIMMTLWKTHRLHTHLFNVTLS